MLDGEAVFANILKLERLEFAHTHSCSCGKKIQSIHAEVIIPFGFQSVPLKKLIVFLKRKQISFGCDCFCFHDGSAGLLA